MGYEDTVSRMQRTLVDNQKYAKRRAELINKYSKTYSYRQALTRTSNRLKKEGLL